MTPEIEEKARNEGYQRAILLLLERGVVALEKIVSHMEQGGVERVSFAEHTPEGDPDYLAAIAAEVEGRIQGASTPKVGREVEIDDTETEEVVEEGIWINLYNQPRKNLAALAALGSKDILIAEASHPEASKLFVAALEVVYSHLPQDQWGSETAKNHIAELIKLHKEE